MARNKQGFLKRNTETTTHRGSLTLRILLVMILLVIPLNLWGIFTAGEIQSSMYAESQNGLYAVGTLTMKDLDSRMEAADYFLFDTLLASDSFFQIVKEQKGDSAFYHAAYNLHSEMKSQIGAGRDADLYFFYSAETDYCDVTTTTARNGAADELRTMLRALAAEEDYETQTKWFLLELDGELYLARFSSQKTLYYGALISADDVCGTVTDSLSYTSMTVEMLEEDAAAAAGTDGTYIAAACASERAAVSLVISVNKSEIASGLPFYQRIGVMLSLIFLCVLPLLIWFLFRYLLGPVKVLLGAMNTVQQGTLDYQITETANSGEFARLYDNFNSMVNVQIDMGKEIVKKEVFAKEMELKTLQLQIRPHFLLNSFNLLYGMVTMNKIDGAQKMILYLSEYFRYIFRSGKNLEAYGQELSMIMQYMDVARLRYPFTAFFETHDEAVLQVEVPPLLIQNFVENVLKHGQNVTEMTTIRLDASYKDGWAVFVIEDDGRGIAPEEVVAINARDFSKKDDRVHVGFANADLRMRYFYGEESSIFVESKPGEGSKITVKLHVGEMP